MDVLYGSKLSVLVIIIIFVDSFVSSDGDRWGYK